MRDEGEGCSVAVAEAAVDLHTGNVSGPGMQFWAAARLAVGVALETLVGTVRRRRETLSSPWMAVGDKGKTIYDYEAEGSRQRRSRGLLHSWSWDGSKTRRSDRRARCSFRGLGGAWQVGWAWPLAGGNSSCCCVDLGWAWAPPETAYRHRSVGGDCPVCL